MKSLNLVWPVFVCLRTPLAISVDRPNFERGNGFLVCVTWDVIQLLLASYHNTVVKNAADYPATVVIKARVDNSGVVRPTCLGQVSFPTPKEQIQPIVNIRRSKDISPPCLYFKPGHRAFEKKYDSALQYWSYPK